MRHVGATLDYMANTSKLASISAALKSVVMLVLIALMLAIGTITSCVYVAITLTVFVIFVGKTKPLKMLAIAAVPLGFVLIGCLPLLFDVSKAPSGVLNIPFFRWYFIVTEVSINDTLVTTSRAIGTISCLIAYICSTPVGATLELFSRLKFPPVVTELMYLTYRFIFVLADSMMGMIMSATARLGYAKGCAMPTTGMIMSSLLLVCFKKSQAFFDAMQQRCLDGCIVIISQNNKANSSQIAVACLYIASCTIVALIGRLC